MSDVALRGPARAWLLLKNYCGCYCCSSRYFCFCCAFVASIFATASGARSRPFKQIEIFVFCSSDIGPRFFPRSAAALFAIVSGDCFRPSFHSLAFCIVRAEGLCPAARYAATRFFTCSADCGFPLHIMERLFLNSSDRLMPLFTRRIFLRTCSGRGRPSNALLIFCLVSADTIRPLQLPAKGRML